MIDKEKVKQAVSNWYLLCQDMGVPLPDKSVFRAGVPCPVCGGTDRFSYDKDWDNFYCRSCGAMDGIALIQGYNDWTFAQTIQEIGKHLGLGDEKPNPELLSAYRRKKDEEAYWLALIKVYIGKESVNLSDDDLACFTMAQAITRKFHKDYGKPDYAQLVEISRRVTRPALKPSQIDWENWAQPERPTEDIRVLGSE